MAEGTGGTGVKGFVFEELMDQTLRKLVEPLAKKGISARLLNEQQIRDEFGEQSLNGVDHFFSLKFPAGAPPSQPKEMLFLIQEKWKLITNQREVSQFLDCCNRILSRMPDYEGTVVKLWVTRTAPTTNGEKSLSEGAAHVIQASTSMCFLAQMAGQYICEVLGDRSLCTEMIVTMPPLLSGDAPVLEQVSKPLLQQDKAIPSYAIHPAKMKVVVHRKDA